MRKYIEPIVVSSACFRSALASASTELNNKEVRWNDFPEIMVESDSFNKRAKAVEEGKKERINFTSEVKNYLEHNESGYTFSNVENGHIHLIKSLRDNFSVGLIIEKISHFGLGKAFTLRIEVQDSLDSGEVYKWDDDLFGLFNISKENRPCYTYSTKDELRSALDSMLLVIETCMPVVESNMDRYFVKNETRLSNLERREILSAKGCYKEAYEIAKKWDVNAKLSGIFYKSYPELRKLDSGKIGLDGHIAPGSFWSYRFYSGCKDEATFVDVPYIGKVEYRSRKIDKPKGKINPFTGEKIADISPFSHWTMEIEESFIDSVEALMVAENNGGSDARKKGNLFGLVISLEYKKSNLVWVIHYLISGNEERSDFHAVVDGQSGLYLGRDPFHLKE